MPQGQTAVMGALGRGLSDEWISQGDFLEEVTPEKTNVHSSGGTWEDLSQMCGQGGAGRWPHHLLPDFLRFIYAGSQR